MGIGTSQPEVWGPDGEPVKPGTPPSGSSGTVPVKPAPKPAAKKSPAR